MFKRSVVLRLEPTTVVALVLLLLFGLIGQKEEERQEAKRMEAIAAYFEANPHREEYRELVEDGRFRRGMNQEELLLVFGRQPDSKTTTVTSLGRVDVWRWGSQYITFQNGIVTGWSTYEL